MIELSTHSLLTDPARYGVPEKMLIHLSGMEPTHVHLSYIDLFDHSIDIRPEAVIEVNGRAALYLVRAGQLNNIQIAELKEILASRADARYFGIIHAGKIEIYPLGLFDKEEKLSAITSVDLQVGNPALHEFLIGNIDNTLNRPKKKSARQAEETWLENYLFRLLQTTARNLKESKSLQNLQDNQILSLVGRGLFTRFIIDRKIIHEQDVKSISSNANHLSELFRDPVTTSETFAWLDRTFNGNLLPLVKNYYELEGYIDFFENLGYEAAQNICTELNDILWGTVDRQLSLEWQRIQFQHVPADMLSQVYEHFAHAYQKPYAKSTSIHYTPRHIAKILVDAAFDGLENTDKRMAKVLDPAAGAGVFLVLAFKYLVKENWKNNLSRPNRQSIRHILNNQLCGLDINSESLKFAALSLYLTALELDPDPTPLSELRFDCLEGRTLRNVCFDDDPINALGSLSDKLPEDLNAKFDIIVGNPPWTVKPIAIGKKFNELVQRIAQEKGIDIEIIKKLDVEGVPDVPFLWRATEWAKPRGMIAFALHAQHTLFNQNNGFELRSALLECIELTGILNGSALRNEAAIWSNNTAPFCFLVARNNKPTPYSSFYYLSPFIEKSINSQGLFRMDPEMAIPIEQDLVRHSPYILKTLFRGTWLDHEIIEKISVNVNTISLRDYWKKNNLYCGGGFQLGSRTVDASRFTGQYLFDIKDKNRHSYKVNIQQLRLFEHDRIHSNREPEYFRKPLVLFLESPSLERTCRGAILSEVDLVYNESYIGFSCATHPHAELLAKYIHLLSYSDLFIYFILMTSAKFGVERDSILTKEIFSFPIFNFDKLTTEQISKIQTLSELLIGNQRPWLEIDNLVASLYGLSRIDQQVIRDSLATSLPYSTCKTWSQKPPEYKTLEEFAEELTRILKPFTDRRALSIRINIEQPLNSESWRFVQISFTSSTNIIDQSISQTFLADLASHFWVSQVQVQLDEHGFEILLGQLAQNRYWTKTRARMIAMDFIGSKLDALSHHKVENV